MSIATPAKRGFLSRLYTGTGAFDVVGKRRVWYTLFGLLMLICALSIIFRGFNLGIEFTGGTQIQFPATSTSTVAEVGRVYQAAGIHPESVQTVGSGGSLSVLVKSEALDAGQVVTIKQALFDAFHPANPGGAPAQSAISDSAVSGSWGGQITRQAIIALAVFLVLVTLFLAFYFERAMAVTALFALVHDVLVTAGVYSIVGFEVTPSTVIGLLTILGFSLYDTVVVFDKVKENTRGLLGLTRRTYGEAANLALNQTLMRSINTSLIAVLPVIGLMVVGVGLLGVGTLADLALVQMVGIIAGALSSLLLATPMLVDLKMRDPRYREQADRVAARRRKAAVAQAGGLDPDLTDDTVLNAELRRERAMAAAASAPARPGKVALGKAAQGKAAQGKAAQGQAARGQAQGQAAERRPARPAGKSARPSGKRSR